MPWMSLSMGLVERGIFPHQRLDLIDGMEHGRVVLATEGPADLGERGVGEVARQIHSDLTGKGHRLGAILGFEIGGVARRSNSGCSSTRTARSNGSEESARPATRGSRRFNASAMSTGCARARSSEARRRRN